MSNSNVLQASSVSSGSGPASTAAALPDSLYSPEIREIILMPLNWQPTEEPLWRSKDLPKTSERLRDLQSASEWRHGLPDAAQPILKLFVRRAAVRWVFASNVLDGVGVQTELETSKILEDSFKQRDEETPGPAQSPLTPAVKKSQLETIQTLAAMEYLHDQLQLAQGEQKAQLKTSVIVPNGQCEGVNAVLAPTAVDNFAACLTKSHILEAHRRLTQKVMRYEGTSGAFRERGAQSQSFLFKGEIHSYPHFDDGAIGVANAMDSLVDEYHAILAATPSLAASRLKSAADHQVAISTLFKLAAWLLFQVVDLHPFADGNGRMCRLLANHVLALECPFPVAPYPVSGPPMVSSDIKCNLFRVEKKGINQPSEYALRSVSVHATTAADYYATAIEKCRYGAAGVEPLPVALADAAKLRNRPTTQLLQHPCDIAALLIENAWDSWRQLQNFLEANGFEGKDKVDDTTKSTVYC